MTYDAYDISQICQSWCLNDRLDLSNHTRSSDFGLISVQDKKMEKMHWKYFPFINFENPLYFQSNFQWL